MGVAVEMAEELSGGRRQLIRRYMGEADDGELPAAGHATPKVELGEPSRREKGVGNKTSVAPRITFPGRASNHIPRPTAVLQLRDRYTAQLRRRFSQAAPVLAIGFIAVAVGWLVAH
jgi:hypothetical protein